MTNVNDNIGLWRVLGQALFCESSRLGQGPENEPGHTHESAFAKSMGPTEQINRGLQFAEPL
jgi:hypothetical protein